MHDLNWSPAEKKIARTAFDAALAKELTGTLADFKRSAQAVADAQQLWEIEDMLRRRRQETDDKYDYRYSQLIWVFGRLLREGWLQEEQLAGSRDDSLEMIRRFTSQA